MCIDRLFQRTTWAVVSTVAQQGAGDPIRRHLPQSAQEREKHLGGT